MENIWRFMGRFSIAGDSAEYWYNNATQEVRETYKKKTTQTVWEHERLAALVAVLLGEKSTTSYMDLMDEARRKLIDFSRGIA